MNAQEYLHKNIGMVGRMMWHSKSGYGTMYPNNCPIFNSNIVLKHSNGELEKVWYGDIDLSFKDMDTLIECSNLYGELYVLYEMDWRFDNQTIDNYFLKITNGKLSLGGTTSKYFEINSEKRIVRISK